MKYDKIPPRPITVSIVLEKHGRRYHGYIREFDGVEATGTTIDGTLRRVREALPLKFGMDLHRRGLVVNPDVFYYRRYRVSFKYVYTFPLGHSAKLRPYRKRLFEAMIDLLDGSCSFHSRADMIEYCRKIAFDTDDEYIMCFKEYNTPEKAAYLLTL